MIDWAVNSAGFIPGADLRGSSPGGDFAAFMDAPVGVRSGVDFNGLGPGQSGPRVERLQKILRKWNDKLGVSATGKFDEATQRAVTLYRAIYTSNSSGPLDDAASSALSKMEDGSFWKDPPTKTPAQKALYQASRSLGTPYRMGGDGVSGTDCGMLTSSALKAAGSDVSRLADEQYRLAKEGKGMSYERSGKAGDLVFFRVPTSQSGLAYGGVTHVGMAIGNGLMVAASSGQGKVVVQPIDDLGPYVAGYGRMKQ